MEATLKETLLGRLRDLDVQKVVLFGSHAWGTPSDDSDVDLLVVLDEDGRPADSSERGELHQRVARRVRDIEREVPIDLIVHTRPMHREFLDRDSMFARKVTRQGQILYMRKATEEWLASARDDLETIDELIDNGQLNPHRCFSCPAMHREMSQGASGRARARRAEHP